MVIRIFISVTALLMAGLITASAQYSSHGTSLTVYNNGAALVHELRTVTLEEGVNQLSFRDVAASIVPTSFNFKSLSDPAGTVVLEQSYVFDRSDAEGLLQRYLGETVTIDVSSGQQYSGELLRLDDNKAALRAGPREIAFVDIYDIRSIQFPSAPADLYSGPTLRLLLQSASAGPHDVVLTYLAGGMNWTADYSIFLSADETELDLHGLVSVSNASGRAYRDASLKLVAGEVSRMDTEELFVQERMAAMSASADESGAVAQRDLGEFKLYAIARPITIEDGETKQIEFVSDAGIAADLTYVFDSSPAFGGYYRPIDFFEGRGAQSAGVRAYLQFNTGDENGLGADLPAGRARVYKADVDGASLLIGEGPVNHTPQGEEVALMLGRAFDLAGERQQTDFSFVSRLVARESFEIRLRNRNDDKAFQIHVPERLYRWRDWRIIESSAPFVKVDAATIEFAVTVEPGAESTLSYTVEYSFPEED